jgi:CheY-like chemotaxis protein
MSMNVCIVDDDPIFITTVNLILSRVLKVEHTLHQFTNPIEALAKFKDRTWMKSCLPLTFLCDINMPGMQGFDLINQLCNHYRDDVEIISKISIYLLTSSISAADKQMADNDQHILGFISKPLSPEKLKELLSIA